MLGPNLEALLSVSSEDLHPTDEVVTGTDGLSRQLHDLLRARNGFYAFESALHVFPSAPSAAGQTLESWNAPDTWRDSFDGLADNLTCFAEDIFGVQFAFQQDMVVIFDPETGEKTALAEDLESWAAAIVTSYKRLTGAPVAHEWQVAHGWLPTGQRLLPKRPFVLGGAFHTENLYAADAVAGMRVRGELAVQIRDLPDGAQVRYRVI